MMKRLLPLFTLCTCVSSANPATAQDGPFDPGSMIVSGSVQLSTTEISGGRVTSVGLAPGLSYFIKPGLAVGGRVSVSAFFNDQATSTSLGLGPQLTYFFNAPAGPEVAGHIVPFVRGSLLYDRSTSKFEISTISQKTTRENINAELAVGGMYMLNTAVGLFLEAQAVFSHSLSDNRDLPGELDVDDTTSTFGLQGGFTIFLP